MDDKDKVPCTKDDACTKDTPGCTKDAGCTEDVEVHVSDDATEAKDQDADERK